LLLHLHLPLPLHLHPLFPQPRHNSVILSERGPKRFSVWGW